MCDFFSLDQADLRSADRASREYVGEIYYLHKNPSQQWYWISGQIPGEMLLFVNYDSDPGEAPPCIFSPVLKGKQIAKQNSVTPHSSYSEQNGWQGG